MHRAGHISHKSSIESASIHKELLPWNMEELTSQLTATADRRNVSKCTRGSERRRLRSPPEHDLGRLMREANFPKPHIRGANAVLSELGIVRMHDMSQHRLHFFRGEESYRAACMGARSENRATSRWGRDQAKATHRAYLPSIAIVLLSHSRRSIWVKRERIRPNGFIVVDGVHRDGEQGELDGVIIRALSDSY